MKKLITPTIIFSFFLISIAFYSCQKNEVSPDENSSTTSEVNDLNKKREHKILILMYHDIVDGTAANIYQRTITDFENDLIYVRSKQLQVLSFDDLLRIKAGRMPLVADAVIFSFDDGFMSHYTAAFPKLKAYNVPATFFIVTEFLGTPNYMTWGNVWNMDQFKTWYGKKLFSIESHTSSHPFLYSDAYTFATPAAYQTSLNAEIGDSKHWIESVTNQTSMWLALPYGDGANNLQIINTAKNYGYKGIRTSMYGSFTIKTMNLYALPSLPILSTTSITDIMNYLN